VIGKGHHDRRRSHAAKILDGAVRLGVSLAPALEAHVRDGFGGSPSGEDQFDSFVGLLG
jgi:hypothetical protein